MFHIHMYIHKLKVLSAERSSSWVKMVLICKDAIVVCTSSVYKTTQNHISAAKYRYRVDDRSTRVVPASIRNILVRVNGVRIDELTPPHPGLKWRSVDCWAMIL